MTVVQPSTVAVDRVKSGKVQDFPGGPVVKTSPSNAGDAGSIPGRGAKILHARWPKNQNIKKYCNKFNKDFKKKWSTSKNLQKKKKSGEILHTFLKYSQQDMLVDLIRNMKEKDVKLTSRLSA